MQIHLPAAWDACGDIPVRIVTVAPLPFRRPSENYEVEWTPVDRPDLAPLRFQIGIGRHADGSACEVFCSERTAGSMLLTMIDDFCVLISRIHQAYGIPIADLARLMRVEDAAVSPLGVPMHHILKHERGGGA